MSIEENTNDNIAKPQTQPETVQKHDQPISRANIRKTGGVYRFFRSIFTHIVFAMLVVTGALGYLLHARMIAVVGDTVMSEKYLGNYMLEPGNSSTTTASQSGASKKPETNTSAIKPVAATNATSATSTTSATLQETSTATPPKVTPPAAPSKVTPTAAPAKVTPPVSAQKPTPQIAATQPKKTTPPVVNVNSKPELSRNPATTQSITTIKKNQPVSNHATLVKSWQLARQYYAAGKAEAEAAYLALIKNHPNNPDLQGELGNIYYNAGKFSQAATQYYNAALLQLNGTRPEIAACIFRVLERIDVGKARALRGKLTRACPFR